MVLPDLGLICEIMLMAEGFQMSKLLSRKFVILYKLCEDLLSKSKHYDWKLRAIKTTLYVAGGMKRSAPELSEDKVGARGGCGLGAAGWGPGLGLRAGPAGWGCGLDRALER
jgi:dynein heavy chain